MNDQGRGGWEPVLPNVEIYRDSCNVYAVSHPGGTVFVNAGTGHWLEVLPARFRAPHTLLCTHYFRDHSAGAANASRRGMRVFAPAGELDILADPEQHFRAGSLRTSPTSLSHPEAHKFPCNWPEALRVDKVLSLGREFTWEEYTLRVEPMSGHTRYSVAILFEADGKRFAHTGDQYFFQNRIEPENDDWTKAEVFQNHVYQNGAFLESYRESARLLSDWRPNIVISGHQLPMFTNDAFFATIDAWGDEYAQLHETAAAVGADDAHFGIDGWGGWIWPYRSHVAEGEAVKVRVTVRNPFNRPENLRVRLVGPEGWTGSEQTVAAGPRAEVSCDLSIVPDRPCRRRPFAAELLVGDRTFGQVCEALVSVGRTALLIHHKENATSCESDVEPRVVTIY